MSAFQRCSRATPRDDEREPRKLNPHMHHIVADDSTPECALWTVGPYSRGHAAGLEDFQVILRLQVV